MLIITVLSVINSPNFMCCFESLRQESVKDKPEIKILDKNNNINFLSGASTLNRIQKSSAAASHHAAQELAGSQHFETHPLQRGLTRSVALARLHRQRPKTHTVSTHLTNSLQFDFFLFWTHNLVIQLIKLKHTAASYIWILLVQRSARSWRAAQSFMFFSLFTHCSTWNKQEYKHNSKHFKHVLFEIW